MPLILCRIQVNFVHIDAFELKTGDVICTVGECNSAIVSQVYQSISGIEEKISEMPNHKTPKNFKDNTEGDGGKSPDWEDKYGLVPPFLIGASTVIILYIIGHCLYLHCYTKKKMKSYVARQQRNPTILVNDPADPSTPLQAVTPVVKYDGSYGTTEMVTATPYLVTTKENSQEQVGAQDNVPVSKRHHCLKVLYQNKPKGPQRPSVCSASAVLESVPTDSLIDTASHSSEGTQTRASICFIPLGKSRNDSPGDKSEWTPLQGFVYSTILLARNPSYDSACKMTPDSDCASASHIVFVPNSNVPSRQNSDRSDTNQPRQSVGSDNVASSAACSIPLVVEHEAEVYTDESS